MDPRLLDYYNRELVHLAELCGEFAREYPKIAGRLGLEGFVKEFQCPDPYVERLLEGFAYMAARVQLKVDAEFPRFTQHLLDMVYPDFLAPLPSFAMVQFEPDLNQSALNDGVVLPRGTVLRSLLGKGDQTPCEYRTGHDVALWPVELADCRYLASTAAVAALGIPEVARIKSGCRLRLRTTAGVPFDKLALDRLTLHLRGGDPIAMRLYEFFSANAVAVIVQPVQPPVADGWREAAAMPAVRPLGFDDAEALLPYGPRSFQGYRLLREYFAFPERYMLVELSGLAAGIRRCTATEVDIVVLFDKAAALFDGMLDASRFGLFCTPAINLFPKRGVRIHLSDATNEYHVVADRSRPLDFEIYGLTSVTGHAGPGEAEREFLPFYACNDLSDQRDRGAYYVLYRTPRLMSSRQKIRGPRSSYIGSEVFLSLVDGNEAPYGANLRQLAVTTLCTNRDLPLNMPVGVGKTDLTLEISAPVKSVRFVAGPTEPRPVLAHRETAWRLISQLSLNYLSLMNTDDQQGAAALREMLDLYAASADPAMRKQIEGVSSVVARPVHRRLPIPGPVSFGRGLEVELTLDETAFEGTGMFLLAAVLEQFFSRYVSINSFTETVLKTPARGEIKRWPARIGRRHLL